MSFRLSIQDYRRHRFGDPRPAVIRECFRTRAEAEAALRAYRMTHPDRNTHVAGVTETRKRRAPVAERQGDSALRQRMAHFG